MAKPNFTLPNKPAIKSGSILSYNYTDDFTFVPAPLTFNRDSAATRVNEKGLIEDVGYFGPELVQNGDFSEIGSEEVVNGDFSDSSWWGLDPVWSISNGSANCNGSGVIYKGGVLTIGKTYKVEVEISSYTSGTLTYPNAPYTLPSVVGSYTFYYKANSQTVSFTGTNFIGSIDNVSVKEVGQNWSFGTGWSMGDGKAIRTAQSGSTSTYQSISFSANKTYKIQYDLDITAGSFKIRISGGTLVDTPARTTSGTYTEYIVANSGNNVLNLRANDGAFVGSIDNISVIEVLGDKPRIDYSDSLTEPSLLLEPQSTNLITYSEDLNQIFTNNSTSGDGVFTITPNYGISPSGTNTATRIQLSASSGSYADVAHLTSSLNGTYTYSVYIKSLSGTPTMYLIYNGSSSIIQTISEDWVRYTFTFTHSGSVIPRFLIEPNGGTSTSADILVWGAMLEQSSYPTSYIPTAGSTATRLGETANNAGDVNVFNSEEGVLYAEFATISKNYNFPTIQLSDGTNSNGVRIFPVGIGTNNIQVQVDSGGSISFVSTSTSNDPTQYNKIAVKYQKDNFSFYINGTQHATDSSGNAPVGLNVFSFLNNFFGKVKDVKIFNKALTDRELEILTIQ